MRTATGAIAFCTLVSLGGVCCGGSGPIQADQVEAVAGDATPDKMQTPDLPLPELTDLTPRELPPDSTDTQLPDLGFDQLQTCGNSVCDKNEGCASCPGDCGQCTVCGNGVCEPGPPPESPTECPEDCGPCGDGVCGIKELEEPYFCNMDCATVCGNGECEPGETAAQGEPGCCPPDCGGCGDGCCGYKDLFDPELHDCADLDCKPGCGDGQCSPGENWPECPVDCGWCGDGVCGKVWDEDEPCPEDCVVPCGDGACEGNETADSCPSDCGWCGDGVCSFREMDLGYCFVDCPTTCGNGICGPDETQTGCPADCACFPACEQQWQCGYDASGCQEPCGACPADSVCILHDCCVPDSCKNKQCGPDGCGGTCGNCSGNTECIDWYCQDPDCQPQCDGNECGENGCGGVCGFCDDGLFCTEDGCGDAKCHFAPVPLYCVVEGKCFYSGEVDPQHPCRRCKPLVSQYEWTQVQDGYPCAGGGVCVDGECCGTAANCEDKECGPDGCGSFCGYCAPGEGCQDGACVPGVVCTPDCGSKACGDDGCGGSCGQCDDGLQCTKDLCIWGQCKSIPAPLYCLVDQACHKSGDVNPVNNCQRCLPVWSPYQWTPVADGMLCDDDDGCTQVDVCQSGVCQGKAPKECEDNNPCTVGQCDPDAGCQYGPVADGTSCGLGHQCSGGVCAESQELCDDGNAIDWDGCTNGILSEYRFNKTTAGAQRHPSVALHMSGSFMVVWESDGQDGDSTGVVARMFTDTGGGGPERVVNQTTELVQQYPRVAMLASGNFIVVWDHHGPADQNAIMARHVASDGTPMGDEFLLDQFTDLGVGRAALAPLGNGGFAAAWWDWDQPGQSNGPAGRTFDASFEPYGPTFVLNQFQDNNESAVMLAQLPNASWAAVWHSDPGGGQPGDAYVRVFSWDAGAATDEVQLVGAQNIDESYPDLAAFGAWPDPHLAAVWTAQPGVAQSAIRAGMFDLELDQVGADIIVLPDNSGFPVLPRVCGYEQGFVVTWAGTTQIDGEADHGIAAQRYNALGEPLGEPFSVSINDPGNGVWDHEIACFSDGGFVSVWEQENLDGAQYGIFGMRVKPDNKPCALGSCETAKNSNCYPWSCDDGQDCTENWCSPLTGQCENPPNHALCDDANPCTDNECDGALGCLATSVPDDEPCGAGMHCIAGACVPVVSDCDDGNAVNWDGCTDGKISEFQINTTEANDQRLPAVSALADGGFAVVWYSMEQDGSSSGVYWQRLDKTGLPSGGEVLANVTTANNQQYADIATLSDGRVLIAWEGYGNVPGAGFAAYARFFLADGTPDSGEILLNSPTSAFEKRPALASLPGVGFAAAWKGNQPDNAEIGGGLFDLTGAPVTGQMQLNDYEGGTEYDPVLATFADGQWVALWYSKSPIDSTNDIFGRRFDETGTPLGAEFQVADDPDDSEFQPAVATFGKAGQQKSVAVWTDSATDGTLYNVRAQVFWQDGATHGSELPISGNIMGLQSRPGACGHEGGFVVTWSDQAAGGHNGVLFKRFDDNGSSVGDTTPVNTFEPTVPPYPNDVACFPDGGFVIVWETSGQEGDGYGIYAKRFTPQGAPCALGNCETKGP